MSAKSKKTPKSVARCRSTQRLLGIALCWTGVIRGKLHKACELARHLAESEKIGYQLWLDQKLKTILNDGLDAENIGCNCLPTNLLITRHLYSGEVDLTKIFHVKPEFDRDAPDASPVRLYGEAVAAYDKAHDDLATFEDLIAKLFERLAQEPQPHSDETKDLVHSLCDSVTGHTRWNPPMKDVEWPPASKPQPQAKTARTKKPIPKPEPAPSPKPTRVKARKASSAQPKKSWTARRAG